MAGSNNGRGGGQKKKLADQYKEVCPPHKSKDLDALIKRHHGDEDKIMQTIQEWWEEPVTPVEPEWEDVNKKASKKKQPTGRGGGGRGPGRGRGRGGGGGRGPGREGGGRRNGRGGRGRGGEGRGPKPKSAPRENNATTANAPAAEDVAEQQNKAVTLPAGVPTTVAPVALQGAWGQKAAAAAAPLPPVPVPVQPVETAPVAPPPPPVPEPPQETAAVETHAVVAPAAPPAPKPTVRSSGNVWATKGSAHLIKAETVPRPPPAAPSAPSPITSRSQAPVSRAPPPQQEEPLEAPPASVLESGLSASVNGANINAAGWKPAAETTQLDSLGTTMTQTIVKETPAPVAPSPEPVPTVTSKPPPTNVLNMGHWETGDQDENLDFGFGSFGAENETPSIGETTMSSTDAGKETSTQTAPQPSASPARPPPGLSIGGATSLPAGAVLVSDLESKLEGTSLGQKPPAPAQAEPTTDMSHAPDAPPGVPQPPTGQILPQGAAPGMPQNYNAAAYGMGMYNYNAAANNGFVAGMHGAPVLAAGAAGVPKPPQGAPAPAPPHLAQGGLYGAPAAASDTNANDANTPGTAMPPGMPGMPAYNPALFYGQQPYQMGQPHGVGGYGYGYGAQFGGAVQGGFGYQQGMMGQSGGYPSYDDQQQQGNSGGYQNKNSGGYRGRGSGNQYQNQYNPQGGYGGQPYGMGYNVDHFNQARGGYGHGGMDPYGGMQQQQQQPQQQQQQGGSNFQNHAFQNDDDDHHKGKKGGRNNGFQQHPQHQLGGQHQQQQQQQSFGLQGGADSNTNSNAGGWSNNQAGGWGGASSWQQGS